MAAMGPFSVTEKRARNSLSRFQGSGFLFSLEEPLVAYVQITVVCAEPACLGTLSLEKGAGQVGLISSAVVLICILVLEIYSIFQCFFSSCFGMLPVHSFVNNEMRLTSG